MSSRRHVKSARQVYLQFVNSATDQDSGSTYSFYFNPITRGIFTLLNSEWCFHSWPPNLLLTCLISTAHTQSWRGQVGFLVISCGILNISCYWGITFQYCQSTSANMDVHNYIFISHRLTLIYDNQNYLFVLKSNIWELL